ncbi:DUF5133 domain-containing protein [Streptomyces avidinii]|uniref:DUF5133 domain-containing protein n=1 Tax=Streptomyces avidinii TaxID=1895 RepID=UPI00378A3C1F
MTGTEPHRAPAGDPFAARTDVARAIGVLMSLVPCGTEAAHRVLVRTARTTDGDIHRAALAVPALLRGRDPQDPEQRAVRAAITAARTGPGPEAGGLRPDTGVLRAHLARFRALRRLALTAPADPKVQARLDDAAYTLCVLLGTRTPHAALRSAGRLLAGRAGRAEEPQASAS